MHFILTFTAVLLSYSLTWAQSCQCEQLSCDECEVKVGLDFYTAPCDGGKVKSCSRPRCRAVVATTGKCAGSGNLAKEEDRTPAKAPQLEKVQISVGTVVEAVGVLSVHRDVDGVMKVIGDVKKGFKIQEKDIVETAEEARAKIVFVDDNILTIAPASKIEIAKVKYSKKQNNNSTLLNLLYGKVRNTISEHNHYDQKDNTFEVKTKSAVAGVRGTDFSTSFKESPFEVTEVETVHGLVNLKSQVSGEEKQVAKDYKLALTVERKGAGPQSFFSMPQKMEEKDHKKLKELIEFVPEKKKVESEEKTIEVAAAKVVKTVCHEPTADYNQCSWHCDGNPKGAKTCRLDMPTVKCARKRCAANGHWVDETRLPASFVSECPAQGFKISDCDY